MKSGKIRAYQIKCELENISEPTDQCEKGNFWNHKQKQSEYNKKKLCADLDSVNLILWKTLIE